MSVGSHLNEKFQTRHDRHLVIGNDEIHVLSLRQPSESGGPMFGFFAGIPYLPGQLMIIDQENTFHYGRVALERCPFYQFFPLEKNVRSGDHTPCNGPITLNDQLTRFSDLES